VIYPITTVTVIVVTANHYFLDAVGGFFVFGVGYVAARIFTRAGRGPATAATATADERATVSRPTASPDGSAPGSR
jgi:hypothetical protein